MSTRSVCLYHSSILFPSYLFILSITESWVLKSQIITTEFSLSFFLLNLSVFAWCTLGLCVTCNYVCNYYSVWMDWPFYHHKISPSFSRNINLNGIKYNNRRKFTLEVNKNFGRGKQSFYHDIELLKFLTKKGIFLFKNVFSDLIFKLL